MRSLRIDRDRLTLRSEAGFRDDFGCVPLVIVGILLVMLLPALRKARNEARVSVASDCLVALLSSAHRADPSTAACPITNAHFTAQGTGERAAVRRSTHGSWFASDPRLVQAEGTWSFRQDLPQTELVDGQRLRLTVWKRMARKDGLITISKGFWTPFRSARSVRSLTTPLRL